MPRSTETRAEDVLKDVLTPGMTFTGRDGKVWTFRRWGRGKRGKEAVFDNPKMVFRNGASHYKGRYPETIHIAWLKTVIARFPELAKQQEKTDDAIRGSE